VAGKRWIKAIGDLAMVLIVLTDKQPRAALSRLFSRTAFILAPLSVLFIKYYPLLGRTYDPWTGRQMFTGVSTDKNLLGVSLFVLLLGAVWRVLAILRSDEIPLHRGRVLFAQGILLATGLYLLSIANSVTSSVCFALGAGLMLATSLRFMRRRAAAVHALVLFLVVAVSSIMLLGGGAAAAQALGRNPSLTGRTEIWGDVIPLAQNSLIGAGFESFWLSTSVHKKLWELIPGLPLNEAHDGYIEVYLELGLIGVGLIAFILIDGYRRSVAAFRRSPGLGSLLIAYVISAAVYSITEAGFRMMGPVWIFLLFAVVASGGISSGFIAESSKPAGVRTKQVRALIANQWVAADDGVRSI
jgi:O-antigen ligase